MSKGQAKKDYQGVIPNVAEVREELSKLPQMGTKKHWAERKRQGVRPSELDPAAEALAVKLDTELFSVLELDADGNPIYTSSSYCGMKY